MTETQNSGPASGTGAPPPIAVWPTIRYRDAPGGIEFLTKAFGFEAVAVYTSDDGKTVEHAELRWPLGGGLMVGSERESSEWPQRAGHSGVYVVTDEPDALYERAVAAGATVTGELRDEDYGSRGFSCRDLEGNAWSFGTYGGQADS
jgi:uncharacterized glyoxalase superfamily protein PhnB